MVYCPDGPLQVPEPPYVGRGDSEGLRGGRAARLRALVQRGHRSRDGAHPRRALRARNLEKDLALLCQKAENDFVGVPSGIMDQYASLLSGVGSALLIDCRSLHNEPVPLDLQGENLALLVCDTRVERGLADTGYRDRRETCEDAARTLGVGSCGTRTKKTSDASRATS